MSLLKSFQRRDHGLWLAVSLEGTGAQPVKIVADQRLQRRGPLPGSGSVDVVFVQVVGVSQDQPGQASGFSVSRRSLVFKMFAGVSLNCGVPLRSSVFQKLLRHGLQIG